MKIYHLSVVKEHHFSYVGATNAVGKHAVQAVGALDVISEMTPISLPSPGGAL